MDAEQAKRRLEVSRGNRLEALYVLAVTAGLRVGEHLGLKWEDVDLNTGTLRVKRTRSQVRTGPIFTTPKNGKGRSIKLTRRAVEVLKAHKAARNVERLKAGSLWQDNNLVYSTTTGKPLDFRNLATASFKPLLEKARLPYIRFHDLRARYVGSGLGITIVTVLLTRSGAAPGASGLLAGWNVAVVVTAGFSLLGALTILLAREHPARPKPDPSQVQKGRRDRGQVPGSSESIS